MRPFSQPGGLHACLGYLARGDDAHSMVGAAAGRPAMMTVQHVLTFATIQQELT